MGQTLSNIYNGVASLANRKKETRISMIGLDAAGKTVVLSKLKHGETPSTIPTIGFNVETFEYKNLRMTMWDVGGQDRIRALWHHYFDNNDAIIFVVDSADSERFDEARKELHTVLEDPRLADVKVLIYANKQDLSTAADAATLTRHLELFKLNQDWYIQSATAITGDGLYDGLEWLSNSLKK